MSVKRFLLLITYSFLLSCSNSAKTNEVGVLRSKELREISGMAIHPSDQKLFYAHNDSGDGSRFYAAKLDGNVVGRFTSKTIPNIDFEDIDIGECSTQKGKQCLYLADIGNNMYWRDKIVIHEFLLPDPVTGKKPKDLKPLKSHKFAHAPKYDAEAFFYSSKLSLGFLVTKEHQLMGKKMTIVNQLNFKDGSSKEVARWKLKLKVTGADLNAQENLISLISKEQIMLLKVADLNKMGSIDTSKARKISLKRYDNHQFEAISFDSKGDLYYISEKGPLKKQKIYKEEIK